MSKGMQQRLGLAQALVGDPKLLLLDEPTSALDPQRTQSLSELLCGLRREGLALLTVTHDAGFARALGARVYRLQDARVISTSL